MFGTNMNGKRKFWNIFIVEKYQKKDILPTTSSSCISGDAVACHDVKSLEYSKRCARISNMKFQNVLVPYVRALRSRHVLHSPKDQPDHSCLN